MPFSLQDAALLNNKLTKQLDKFAEQALPVQSSNNTETEAWRLLLSQRMKSFAEAFNKKAVSDAVKAGVLFDHSKSPKPAGVEEDVYSGDLVRVSLKTKKGSNRVDYADLERRVLAHMTADEWALCLAGATRENAAPHTFSASLKT